VGWQDVEARVAFGVRDQEALARPETALERRYALRCVKQRLHQADREPAPATSVNSDFDRYRI